MNFKKISSQIGLFGLCTSLLLLSGCAKKAIHIDTKAFLDKASLPKGFEKRSSFAIYILSSLNGKKDKNSLQAKELTEKISILLKNRGYRVATNPQEADYCLIFKYGIDAQTKTINIPKTTSQSSAYGYWSGNYRSEEVTYIPEERTFYTKFVICHVFDRETFATILKSVEEQNELPDELNEALWIGKASTIDTDGDLREYLDALLVSLYELFGKSLRGTKETKTTTANSEVQSLHKKYVEGYRKK